MTNMYYKTKHDFFCSRIQPTKHHKLIIVLFAGRYVVMIAMLFHTGNFLLTAYGTWAESRPLLLLATVLR